MVKKELSCEIPHFGSVPETFLRIDAMTDTKTPQNMLSAMGVAITDM